MFNHPQFKLFVNNDRHAHGPLIRYNVYVMWMVYKHCVQDPYRLAAYTKMMNAIPLSRIISIKQLAHLKGHRTIHNVLYIMTARSNVKELKELGIPKPPLTCDWFHDRVNRTEHNQFLMKRLCYRHQHVMKHELYVDICNMWSYVQPDHPCDNEPIHVCAIHFDIIAYLCAFLILACAVFFVSNHNFLKL